LVVALIPVIIGSLDVAVPILAARASIVVVVVESTLASGPVLSVLLVCSHLLIVWDEATGIKAIVSGLVVWLIPL